MTRVKRGVISNKSRRNILKRVKGFRFGRSKKERQAREALVHAGRHAYNHRKQKKADFRGLWNIKISAATKDLGLSYNSFINLLKKKEIDLDRKILADLAENEIDIFKRLVTEIKK